MSAVLIVGPEVVGLFDDETKAQEWAESFIEEADYRVASFTDAREYEKDAEPSAPKSPFSQDSFEDLFARIEDAVDAHPKLTRKLRASNLGLETAKLSVDRLGWSAVIRVKLKGSRKSPYEIHHHGETQEAAVRGLIDGLDHWAEAMK